MPRGGRPPSRPSGGGNRPPVQNRQTPPMQNRQTPPMQNRQTPPMQNRQPPPTQNRQPPPTQNRQPPPTQNRQPPPTQNRQPPPTQNRQPPPTQNRQPPPLNRGGPPPSRGPHNPEHGRRPRHRLPPPPPPPPPIFSLGLGGGFYYGGGGGNPVVSIFTLCIIMFPLVIFMLGPSLPIILGCFSFVAVVAIVLCYKYNKDRAEAIETNRLLSMDLNTYESSSRSVENLASQYEEDTNNFN